MPSEPIPGPTNPVLTYEDFTHLERLTRVCTLTLTHKLPPSHFSAVSGTLVIIFKSETVNITFAPATGGSRRGTMTYACIDQDGPFVVANYSGDYVRVRLSDILTIEQKF